ncbi:hypothetical protein Btru_035545 [Bulinus truncatus]|nr:hypothetical protein Btru_035545 [Bulinus truncatus]
MLHQVFFTVQVSMAEQDLQLRQTSLGQADQVEYRYSCNFTKDTVKYAKRLNEDLDEVKENLKPLSNDEMYNCPTGHRGIMSPHQVVELMNKLRNFLCESEKYFREHIRYHPDSKLMNEQRCGRVYSSSEVMPHEESGTDNGDIEFMTRLRSSCSHMERFVKILTRNIEDFQQSADNLKLQSNGSIVCIRSMKDTIVVEDVCQLLSDARQNINDTKRVFIKHLEVHTEIKEEKPLHQETENTANGNTMSPGSRLN